MEHFGTAESSVASGKTASSTTFLYVLSLLAQWSRYIDIRKGLNNN